MNNTTNAEAISEWVADLHPRNIPATALDAARRSLVDWVGVSVGATSDPATHFVRALAEGWRTAGGAISLFGDRGAPIAAALVNATLGHWLDYDDFHLGSAFHAGNPTWSAALAVGMDRKCSGEAILAAVVAGFEVGVLLGEGGAGVRLANAGWHPTSVLARFSCAVAVSYLLGLDAHRIRNALGLAATSTGGLMATAGTMAKPAHVGFATMDGIVAAELGGLGVTAPHDVLDDPQLGVFATLFQDRKALPRLRSLGSLWQITKNTFKPYAACQLTHAPIDAAREIRPKLRGREVVRARVHVNPFAVTIAGKSQPATASEGKFSIAYCVALALSGHEAVPEDYSTERLADSHLRGLTDRVEIIASDSYERWAARLDVVCGDGSLESASVSDALGSLKRPMEWPDLDAKFLALARPVFGAETAGLLDTLHHFDEKGRSEELARRIEAGRTRRD